MAHDGIRPNKRIPVFRVSGFLEKKNILCILKGEMPFKMHKSIYFSRKKIIQKKSFQTSYRKHSFFYLALPKDAISTRLVTKKDI